VAFYVLIMSLLLWQGTVATTVCSPADVLKVLWLPIFHVHPLVQICEMLTGYNDSAHRVESWTPLDQGRV
jgi:hypothetical protein